jgi:hypothetical protein
VWSYIVLGTERREPCGWCGRPLEYARSVAYDIEVPFDAPLRVGTRGRVDLRQLHVWCKQRQRKGHTHG